VSTRTYRAFISYNRADAAIAAALATSLTRFARPWYSPRAMRVFLDKNSLASDPTLSGAIERGLARSEWLILIASPNSAAAPWVRHELEWWLAHRELAKLIIARAGGVIVWNGRDAKDFDWSVTTALPPVLRGRFTAEPLWADLAAAAATRRKTLSNPVYRDAFLVIAAQIHGLSKDALWNAERAEQRKRVAFAAALSVAVVAFAWAGYNQYSVSMDRKENLASIQLGAKAFLVLSTDPSLAAQLALAGVALRPSGMAASALRSALARIAGDVAPRFEATVPGAIDLAFAQDATRLAVLGGDGRVTVLDLPSGRVLHELAPAAPDAAQAIAWGRDGTLAIGGRAGLQLWNLAAATPSARTLALPAVRSLAFAADGKQLALAHADGSLRIVAVADGTTSRTWLAHPNGAVRAVAFSNDAKRLASGAEDGEVVLWALADARAVLRFRLAHAVVSVDFNREGGSTLAEHMLAVADAGGAVRVIDADAAPTPAAGIAALRSVDFPPGTSAGVAARFATSGRCLARTGARGPIEVDATLGFDRLFVLGRTGTDGAPTIALAMAATRHFARLDAAGHLAVYEQPLCGDAEALCAFAEPRLTAPLTAQNRRRWIPADVELDDAVQKPPGPACRALIDRLVRSGPAGAAR
jgi:hypothetical protein